MSSLSNSDCPHESWAGHQALPARSSAATVKPSSAAYLPREPALVGQALARRIGFHRVSAPAARRIGSACAPPARAQDLSAAPDSGAERGCVPGQPSAGRADAQSAAAGLRERRGGQARLANAAQPCTREAGGSRAGLAPQLSDLGGAVTLADAARLPPCVLMSSYTDVTVPWCVAISWFLRSAACFAA